MGRFAALGMMRGHRFAARGMIQGLTSRTSSMIIDSMNVEQESPDVVELLEARAARHAALADPTRLRIADLLATGDLAPSEIQAALALSSNLVAHHLATLESAGLVVRRRSEADRRRTYLSLVPGAFDRLAPAASRPARRIVFVCTANSARSQLAAALWSRESDVPTATAGTHPAARIEPGAHDVARRNGIELPDVLPVHLDDVLAEGDLVVTVCDAAHEELRDRGAVPGSVHWAVSDPVRTGTATAFDAAFADLDRRIRDAASLLVAA